MRSLLCTLCLLLTAAVAGPARFALAVRTKLIREIAGGAPIRRGIERTTQRETGQTVRR
jgi:hypothetical protein